jgi:hypothetical protein
MDKVLECVDAALAVQGDDEEEDAGELYGVARYLMPAAMI